jgi:hypothetical protein
MALTALDIQNLVKYVIDDANWVRVPSPVFLRACSRAQQWVAIRHGLVRTTTDVTLASGNPLYKIRTVIPRAFALTHVSIDNRTLHRIPQVALGQTSPTWLKTPATSTTPVRWWYTLRWSWLGFAPIPNTTATAQVTAILAPATLTQTTENLVVPDVYGADIAAITAGLLLLARERDRARAVQLIALPLGMDKLLRATSGEETLAHALGEDLLPVVREPSAAP